MATGRAGGGFDPGGGEAPLSEATAFLKALAHEGRLEILCLLIDRGRTVGEIAATLGMTQPTASQQLTRLRLSGIVRPERDGRRVIYRLAEPGVATIVRLLRDRYCPSG